jgi:hypothetical protein
MMNSFPGSGLIRCPSTVLYGGVETLAIGEGGVVRVLFARGLSIVHG